MLVNSRSLLLTLFVSTILLCSVDAVAQRYQNITLSAEVALNGSKPYREAVARFINKQEPKIIGGAPAPAGAYPWQVSLGVAWIVDPYRAHFCGGTVYSSSWIVTAGHCLDDTAPNNVVVTAGTVLLGVDGTRRNVNRIIIKSNFDPKTMDNDIALIELSEPLPLGKEIKSIPLLTLTEEKELLKKDAPLVVVGWGATRQGGKVIRDLRFVEVPFVERATCNRPLAYDGRITNNMICAGVSGGGKDSCQGDSGGPLTADTELNARLAGVVSWGEGCARPNKVGIYSRVANYAEWIKSCIADPNTCK